jgi:radical SAM protein with 4Fe4S-binding SPASM domain
LILCGGEPLLSPYLAPILENVLKRKNPYRVSILTNGTLAPKVDISLLKRFKRLDFQVSLDGPNAETHDAVRGRGSFERTRKGIQYLIEHGFEIEFLSVLTKRSSTDIHEYFQTAKTLGASHMGFTRLIAQGYAEGLVQSGEDRPLNALELKSAFINILKESAQSGIPTKTHSPLMNLLHPALGRNGRFWESIVIDYQGNLLASSRSRIKLGSILEQRLEGLFLKHRLLKDLRQNKIKTCGDCSHIKKCGGDRNAAFAHTGDYLGADPGCWIKLKQA